MKNLPPFLVSLLLGLVLSLPWGIAAWLKWQHMKDHTILPTGSLTARHGRLIGYLLNAMCIGIALSFIGIIKVWVILSAASIFFIGGWIATLLERKLYCSSDQIKIILGAAEEYARLSGPNGAAEVLGQVAPKWWLKLMPAAWQQELRIKLQPILLPDESHGRKKNS